MNAIAHPRLTLGPVLYYWTREALLQFYEQAERWPVDVIYLGEVVCSKRKSLRTGEWIELARTLTRSGKEVVLSTLTLIEAESELSTIARLCNNGELLIEANDMAAVNIMIEKKLPFMTGPAVNIYNAQTLHCLQRRGLVRWVAPVELPETGLRTVLSDAESLGFRDAITTEVLAFGHMPLAWSARCFTARAHNIPKDQCGFVCLEYPDGLPVHTQDGQRFLTLNGIQTQSGQVLNLAQEWQALADAGVQLMRISPQARHTAEIVNEFAAALKQDRRPELDAFANAETCNGYWYGSPGTMRQDQTAF
jgi:collagenase-like PrtC family protease